MAEQEKTPSSRRENLTRDIYWKNRRLAIGQFTPNEIFSPQGIQFATLFAGRNTSTLRSSVYELIESPEKTTKVICIRKEKHTVGTVQIAHMLSSITLEFFILSLDEDFTQPAHILKCTQEQDLKPSRTAKTDELEFFDKTLDRVLKIAS